jgi:predicted permease
MDREMRFHVEALVREHVAAGMSEEDARRAARKRFGNVVRLKEHGHDVRGAGVLEAWGRDFVIGARSLRRTPAFAATAITTLALGIGAVTAIFSVVNATMLRPLPYPEPDAIAALLVGQEGAYHGGRDYLYLQERAQTFEAMAAFGLSSGWNLSTSTGAEYVSALPVSVGYFEVLGVRPLMGRTFAAAEDLPNGPNAVVISASLWERAFASRPSVVGEVVSLGGRPHTVVGVMPQTFRSIPRVDTWTPLRATPGSSGTNNRVLARLSPGATLAQANAELDAARVGLLELPNYNEERAGALRWVSYRQTIGLGARTPLLLLLGAVGLLMLIACFNVAGLQTARALERRHEMATRAALGAGRGALARRALAETMIVAAAGGGAGLGLAVLAVGFLQQATPLEFFEDLTAGQPTSPDWRVAAAVLGCAGAAGLIFGAFPALVAASSRMPSMTSPSGRMTPSRATIWLRRGFATAQLALTVVLLTSAGLFVRTIAGLTSVDVGFNTANLVVAQMSLRGDSVADPARLNDLIVRGVARLREIPGVVAVSASNGIPVDTGINLPVEPPDGALIGERRSVDWRYVSPGYFDTLRIPVITGRAFDSRDAAGGPPVAIVNEAFARTYFGTAIPLGRQLTLVPQLDDSVREIVGVVADVRARSNAGWVRGLSARAMPASPTLYVPAAQAPRAATQAAHGFFPMHWIMRTTLAPAAVERDAIVAMEAVDPTLPFISLETMDQVLADDVAFHRFLTTLIGLFSVVAVVLSGVGLYGLIAYTVSRRTHETGVRMALGATAGRILRGFMTEGVLLAVAGLVLGLGLSTVVTGAAEFLLFGVAALDPATFAAVGLLLLLIAALATLIPASRAATTDPSSALRVD